MSDKCPACNKLWIDHPGIILTCVRLQTAIKTIREIRTMAACDVSGLGRDLVKICDKTLEEMG